MERAKSLLNAGYDPVSSVAEKVGFRDAKNFATAFKKQFGYPPSRQRYEF
jgi:transcriptional regulator GlxA family with amidase domain